MDIIVDGKAYILPVDCFSEVCSFLEVSDILLKLSLVSKLWRELSVQNYIRIRYHFRKGHFDLFQSVISGYYKITRIRVDDCKMVTEDMVHELLSHCKQLFDLRLEKTEFRKFRIPKHESLRILDLTGNRILEMIEHKAKRDFHEKCIIEELNLNECNNVNPSVLLFQRLQHCLRRLYLKANTFLEDDDVEAFSKFWGKMESLDISEYKQSHGTKFFFSFVTYILGLSDKSIKFISENCKRLRDLNISHMKHLTDKGIEFLAQLPELYSLQIVGGSKLTIKAVETIAKLEKLRALDISQCNYVLGYNENRAVELIGSMNLREITISFVGLQEKSILYLAQRCQVFKPCWMGTMNDHVLKKIALNVNYMVELDLTACKRVSDWGLMDLTKFWKGEYPLKKLVIQKHGARLTKKGIDEVKKKWKGCVCVHDF